LFRSVNPVDSVPVPRFHSLPEPECNCITRSRACLGRAALVGYFREAAEYLCVFALVFVDYKVRAVRTGNAMLRRALDRADGLRPEAVLPAVPEEPGLIGCTDERHGPAGIGAHAPGKGQSVSEGIFRNMTGGARDLSVGAETFVEEELLPQFYRLGVISISVRWVGRQRWKRGKREGAYHFLIFL